MSKDLSLTKKIKVHFKLPIYYNDNTTILKQKFVKLEKYFLKTYGGLSIGNKTL